MLGSYNMPEKLGVLIYQRIVDEYGATKQATIARQQLANLRNA